MSASDQETAVRSLFAIPERVAQMDFTVKLADGIAQGDDTVDQYVITPAIAAAFDEALGRIDVALSSKKSVGDYLHGSFGSGKSHFMAMLGLLLAGHEGAWRRRELHELRARFDWIGEAKVLELHMNYFGLESVSGPIFRAYLDYLAAHHPEADLPSIFADEALFADAARQLEAMGDEAFFAPMNAGAGAKGKRSSVAAGWKRPRWNRARFESACVARDLKERAALFTALTRSHFQAFRQASHSFVAIDEGLEAISEHAQRLGYDVIVLLLDELVLWLSMEAARPERLNAAVQQMVKLVDHGSTARPIPCVSFIARQRDLAEMVGDDLAGLENSLLRHALDLAQGRFGRIELGDQNLPAIVERRVLQPRNEAAARQLDETFARLRQQSEAKGSWATLLGTGHDAAAFRKLYPFSPVLIDALVALSNSLQRQRTAIRLLTELLMGHIEDLKLGDLVGVGDLFDVLLAGERSAARATESQYLAARDLYLHELLPMIRAANRTDNPEDCQRARDDHPVALGCSNCPKRACRDDNRILKTLLIAALVPRVPAFEELTVGRLVRLNHGRLHSKIPGRETRQVVAKLKKWAAELGQLRVGDQDDPRVSIELSGVDIRPILEQARERDSDELRKRVLCELLFAAMGIEAEPIGRLEQAAAWRGTKRPGIVRFANVRRLGDEELTCPGSHDWQLVIDYPFDEPGRSPADDERRLAEFCEQGAGSWTLVWLPSFFSKRSNDLLGELGMLNHILSTKAKTQEYVGRLSVEHQEMAKSTLRSLQAQKRAQLLDILTRAYGIVIAPDDDEDLDAARRVEKHLHLLKPGAQFQKPLVATLDGAFLDHVKALLSTRYPRHPSFDRPLSSRRVEAVLARFGELVEAPGHKLGLDRKELEDVRGILGELGIVRATEDAVHLDEERTLERIDSRRRQSNVEHPTAAEVARWFDESGVIGLQPDVEAIVIRAYARWSGRTLVRGGQPYAPRTGRAIDDDVVLELPELPSPVEWKAALELAGRAFGITMPGKARTGDNLARLQGELGKATRARARALELPRALAHWSSTLELPEDTDRMATARAAAALVEGLQGQPALAQVRLLAGFLAEGSPFIEVSAPALGQSLAQCDKTVAALDRTLALGVFRQLRRQRPKGARDILETLASALRRDELQVNLAERLPQLAQEGQTLIERASPAEPVPTPEQAAPPREPPRARTQVRVQREARGAREVQAALDELSTALAEAQTQVTEGGASVRLRVELHLWTEEEA